MITSEFTNEGLQPPTFEELRGGMMATIQRERYVQIMGNKTDETKQSDTVPNGGQKGGQNGGQKGGQKTWELVLDLIKANPSITRSNLSELLGISTSAVQKHIEKLKKLSVIKRVGGDRGGYWLVVDNNIAELSRNYPETIQNLSRN